MPPAPAAPAVPPPPDEDRFAPLKKSVLDWYGKIYKLSDQQDRTLRKKQFFLIAYTHSGGKVAPACRVARICRKTFYNWCRTDADFKRATEEMPGYLHDYMEDLLIHLIFVKKDGASIRYWLDRKHPGYRKPPRKVVIKHAENKTLDQILAEANVDDDGSVEFRGPDSLKSV